MKYIYRMSFYKNRRCINSVTDMYYLKEEHTRWGHNYHIDGEVCRIFVVEVDENSNEYNSAVNNSFQKDKEPSIK